MLLRKGNSFVWYMLHSKQHARYVPARRCSRADEHFGTTMFFGILNGPSTDRVRILITFTRSTFCKITQVILNKKKKIKFLFPTKLKRSNVVTKSAKEKTLLLSSLYSYLTLKHPVSNVLGENLVPSWWRSLATRQPHGSGSLAQPSIAAAALVQHANWSTWVSICWLLNGIFVQRNLVVWWISQN